MSPEQAVGEREIDGRSDLYSLGVVAYQMLTGRLPFTAGNSMAMLLKHVSERPPAIADLRPDAPRWLRDAIERAMMKSPEDRWPTAAALRDALLSDTPTAPWRGEAREPVRYASPRPDGARAERAADRPERVAPAPASAPAGAPAAVALPARPAGPPRTSPGTIAGDAARAAAASAPREGAVPLVMEPPAYAALTPEEKADLRLWHGRTNLSDRIRAMRGYAWLTAAAYFGAMFGIVGAVEAEIPPLVLAPLVPLWMTRKAWLRGKSLRASGLKLRRVLLMPRAKWVLPRPPAPPSEAALLKLAPREVVDGPHGHAIRRAVAEKTAILELVAGLSKADRAMLPDVAPTANALVERVAHLAQAIWRLEAGIDPEEMRELDERIAAASAEGGRDGATPSDDRGLALLRRQRASFEDLVRRRTALVRQLESAGLMLGNLRLDLIKLRSSGLQSALSDVSSATQEARALSREIGTVLEAAAEVKGL
jgi:serine/threonine-protein kinase